MTRKKLNADDADAEGTLIVADFLNPRKSVLRSISVILVLLIAMQIAGFHFPC